ncbi:hypothetical protein M7I_5818 [Glarea lozoyensis 74030]|uniref:Uncharacterized protein n=1 Tax=Glarea lozoyensis (strain ATCC 74030 / MF5533) TaxID=1104152 RepID=H0ET00_GLAL7|nr:hypothetical protein M7I_5818 [Glarea lozoyensis 74030]
MLFNPFEISVLCPAVSETWFLAGMRKFTLVLPGTSEGVISVESLLLSQYQILMSVLEGASSDWCNKIISLSLGLNDKPSKKNVGS